VSALPKTALAIHGGAGTLERSAMTPEKEAAYTEALRAALRAGDDVLCSGGDALTAVEQAVRSLEDCPLFNAGRGAVFTHSITHELDASIMDGKTLAAGAVAGVSGIANPVQLARAVMDKSNHVLLAGKGALEFAALNGFEIKPEEYFFSEFRYNQLMQVIHEEGTFLDHSVSGDPNEKKFGTVGAVALDVHGNLAAATSTGGMTNKRFGRIGDTPLIGAGTYANNATCAVSCTGHGEYFIRSVVAYDVSCLMEYGGLSLEEACIRVVNSKLVARGGEGGLIAVDRFGNICLPFNSTGMYRAWKTSHSDFQTAIF
jgi:beta-aspartyl-peptidase (threonine type)